jgi:hypothetical protein
VGPCSEPDLISSVPETGQPLLCDDNIATLLSVIETLGQLNSVMSRDANIVATELARVLQSRAEHLLIGKVCSNQVRKAASAPTGPMSRSHSIRMVLITRVYAPRKT